jgi:hypothetical protein
LWFAGVEWEVERRRVFRKTYTEGQDYEAAVGGVGELVYVRGEAMRGPLSETGRGS